MKIKSGVLLVSLFALSSFFVFDKDQNSSTTKVEPSIEIGETKDCWLKYTRGGYYYRRVCKITVDGIVEKCKIVMDLESYNNLSTCEENPI